MSGSVRRRHKVGEPGFMTMNRCRHKGGAQALAQGLGGVLGVGTRWASLGTSHAYRVHPQPFARRTAVHG